MTLALREAAPADALCIGVLAMQVFLDTYATEGVRPDLAREALAQYSPASFEARIGDPAQSFMLAERSGALLGFSECSLASEPPQDGLSDGIELVRLYVQRAAQRQGVGKILLRRAEAYAVSCGKPRLWLTAWTGNANARAFYLAQGYRDAGATEYAFEGRSYENRIYERDLRP
jgi:GNAT superfamily N-acetyltransferase